MRFWPDYHLGDARLLIAMTCILNGQTEPVYALLDTGAEWCVVPPSIAEKLGYDLTPDSDVPPLHSRFGICRGRLERITITFPADHGEALHIDSTCFLSEDWPGQFVVIGWKGCLERMRFALDPTTETLYFAASR